MPPLPITAEPPRGPAAWLPVVAGLLVSALAVIDPSVFSDGDPFWHVAVGKWIATHHQVPTADVWSFTWPGLSWTAHEWLSELLMYAVQQRGGWPAVQIMMAGAFGVTTVVLFAFLQRRLSLASAVTLGVIGLAMMSNHFVVRPHVLVWPLTAIWMAALVHAAETRTAPSWWLVGVLILWANLHASFTLALGLAGAIGLEALYVAGDARRETFRRWALFLSVVTLGVLVNPRGLHAITHAAGVMNMKATLAIVAEWHSANFHHFQYILLWFGVVLLAAFTGRLRLSPVRILMVLGLLYLALKHQRYHALLGLVSPFVLATPLAIGLRGEDGRESPSPISPQRSVLLLPAFGVLFTLCVVLLSSRIPRTPTRAVTPVAALAAFEATGRKGRVFNAYELGGYLIYRGIPVFIDGRGDMYGDAFMKEAADASWLRVPHALDTLLQRYDITWTLLRPDAPATELLDHLPGWERLYTDSVAVVHVRRATR